MKTNLEDRPGPSLILPLQVEYIESTFVHD
jgi:hypothetical protein